MKLSHFSLQGSLFAGIFTLLSLGSSMSYAQSYELGYQKLHNNYSSASSAASQNEHTEHTERLLNDTFPRVLTHKKTHSSQYVHCVETTDTAGSEGKVLGTISSTSNPKGAYVAQLPNKKVYLVSVKNQHTTPNTVFVPSQHCQ